MTKAQLQKQVKELRSLVRGLLPEYEAAAEGYFPETAECMRQTAKDIRRYLRDTTPARLAKFNTY